MTEETVFRRMLSSNERVSSDEVEGIECKDLPAVQAAWCGDIFIPRHV